jgi:hypothetical protein
MWKFPTFWERGIELSQHVDAVMHLLFLGVQKTTVLMIQDWATSRGKNVPFVKHQAAERSLAEIQKLGLDWCKALPYNGGKLGGWVSENYLAMARVQCWFYDKLDEVAPDNVFVEPTEPLCVWQAATCRAWLRARDMPTVGTVAELRTTIADEIDREGGPRKVIPPTSGPVKNVFRVVGALHSMMSRLMEESTTEEKVRSVRAHIKLFLTVFEMFDKDIRNEDEKPKWIGCSNFISLLNLPGVMERFGPLRNLWEGGGQGEKILQVIKPSWVGYRKNWHKNIMDAILRDMAMSRIDEKYCEREQELEENQQCRRRRKKMKMCWRPNGRGGGQKTMWSIPGASQSFKVLMKTSRFRQCD